MTPVRVGVVGAGVMGQRHLRALSASPSAQVVGIADHSGVGQQTNGVPRCADVAGLLALSPEAVVVATPAASHRAIVEACIASGVHVLVEKPIATSVRDACHLVDRGRRAGCLLAVGHVERFASVVTGIRDAVRAAAPTLIATRRLGPRPVRVRDVGVLLDLAVHDIDLVRSVTGREYIDPKVELRASSGGCHEDMAILEGALDDGTQVRHEVSWLADEPVRAWSVVGASGQRQTYDLSHAGNGALVAQDEAFLAACRGAPFGSLASGDDGAAAVSVALTGDRWCV